MNNVKKRSKKENKKNTEKEKKKSMLTFSIQFWEWSKRIKKDVEKKETWQAQL